MTLNSQCWSCTRCGAAFIGSDPPEHGLCGQCVADLEALARARTGRQPALPAVRRPGLRRLRQGPDHPHAHPARTGQARPGGERR
jgi:hypothetical protein